jgi:hypothetical protein
MNCNKCGTDNPDSAEYCHQCGGLIGGGHPSILHHPYSMPIAKVITLVCLFFLVFSPLLHWISIFGGGMLGIESWKGWACLLISLVLMGSVSFAIFSELYRFIIYSISMGWGILVSIWMLINLIQLSMIRKEVDNAIAKVMSTQISPGVGIYVGLLSAIGLALCAGFMGYSTGDKDQQILSWETGKWTFPVQSGVVSVLLAIMVSFFFTMKKDVSQESSSTQIGSDASSTDSVSDNDFELNFGEGNSESSENGLSEYQKEKLQDTKKEIDELLQERKKDERDEQHLKKFSVKSAKYYKRESSIGKEPVIEVTVHNGTDKPVSRVYFDAVYQTPDRAIPWLEETFNYSISGGLEPGENAHWKLSPYGGWDHIEVKEDAQLKLDVYQLDGPDEETLWRNDRFTEDNQERLESLRNTVEKLSKEKEKNGS